MASISIVPFHISGVFISMFINRWCYGINDTVSILLLISRLYKICNTVGAQHAVTITRPVNIYMPMLKPLIVTACITVCLQSQV